MRMRLVAPAWGHLPALVMALVCVLVAPAAAQPKHKAAASRGTTDRPTSPTGPKRQLDKTDKKKDQGQAAEDFDFNALDLNGRMRTPQLLYFLERANEELERASLEKRSFIPHMVRSLEEEAL